MSDPPPRPTGFITTRKRHVCAPPMRDEMRAAGSMGDLWRCHCRRLWRVGRRCDLCEHYGHHNFGMCTVGTAWRPATLWQRMRNWRRP